MRAGVILALTGLLATHTAWYRTRMNARSCDRHRPLAIVAALYVAFGSVVAHAAPNESTQTWVIPPGQEAIVTAMLGREHGIAGCVYRAANVEPTRIAAQFSCSPGDVTVPVVLEHVREGGCAGLCSTKFHVTITNASGAPATFATALIANIRAEEQAFTWRRAGGNARRSPERARDPWAYAANGAIILAVIVIVFRVVRKARGKG